MKEFIGVKSWLQCLSESALPERKVQAVKRDALIFHRLAIPYFNKHLLKILRQSNTENSKYLADEFEWLSENGIIFEPEDIGIDNPIGDDEIQRYQKLEFSEYSTVPKPDELIEPDPLFVSLEAGEDFSDIIKKLKNGFSPLFNLVKGSMTGAEYQVRRISLQLRKLKNLDAYPIAPLTTYLSQQPEADKSSVVQILLSNLPVPDDSVSWEQILEYRSDPDSESKFLALRNWMNEVARAKITSNEIEEKLEYLINQYRRHLHLHKMKTNSGSVETIVVASAEFIEDLAKLKLGKIAKGIFSLKHRKLALMEGELSSPGSEVAYIVKARETFK